METFALFVLCLLQPLVAASDIDGLQPEQVHIAYGATVDQIVITWSTRNATRTSLVEYGVDQLQHATKGRARLFVDGGPLKREQYIHMVTLDHLQPHTVYVYHCGSDWGWSELFTFRTPPPEDVWQPSFAVYGDMGSVNAQSLSRLQEETQRGMYDAILHVGDFAYDMDSDNGKVGDEFFRQIESIAAYVPYMTCPGNHEEKYNFSNYINRFNMPSTADSSKLFYSIDMGPIHLISIDTEFYFFLNYGLKSVVLQYMWLVKDLQKANEPQNRARHPWIIIMGHRPMYCSNSDSSDCIKMYPTRVGLFDHLFALEKLLLDYGVDLAIWAHQHSYERLWPIYDYEVRNGSLEAPYMNARAPIHITTGSAGCDEDHSEFKDAQPPWSAFRNNEYGYSRMKVYNKTHLHFEQVSDESNGVITDSIWIVKDKGKGLRRF